MTDGSEPLTVVTGCSRGIGAYVARAFLADTDVLNISRTPAHVPAVPGHTPHDLLLDLGDVERIEPRLSAWFDTHPRYAVTSLIHNAAVSNPGRLDACTTDAVDQAFRVNVHAPLALTAALLRGGRFAERGARVTYVTSSLGRPAPELSFAGLGLYSVTKAALSRLALVQAREFELTAPHISVARVHPGIVDTELQRGLRTDPDQDPAFTKKTAGLPPYREGEWHDRSPKDEMRTITAELAAEFVVWAARHPWAPAHEWDFYHTEEFHRARTQRPRVPGEQR